MISAAQHYLRASSSTSLVRRHHRTFQKLAHGSPSPPPSPSLTSLSASLRNVTKSSSVCNFTSSSTSSSLLSLSSASTITNNLIWRTSSRTTASCAGSLLAPFHSHHHHHHHQHQHNQRQQYHQTPLAFHVGGDTGSCGVGTPDDGKNKKGGPPKTNASKREEQVRIVKMLYGHVWPSPTTTSDLPTTNTNTTDGNEYTQSHIITPSHAKHIKTRVLYSLALMLGGKAVTIQVPFLFKHLIDSLPNTITPDTLTTTTELASTTLPLAMILGYGISRATASGMQELRNATFAHVAQDTIRRVGTSTFQHLHSLDMTYHLSRNTGTLGRVLDRGNRSISFVLNAMVFNVVPTTVEVGVVTGLMAWEFGSVHSGVVLTTITAYTAYTVAMTQWRTKFRKDMNRMENEASGKVSDSLLNYETVKYFNNEGYEVRRYEESLVGYQKAALQAQSSLSLLNFGQNAIFSAGLAAIMYVTYDMILAGEASLGDLVLVNGLLFQLSIPLNFIGSVYREIKQAFIDMEAMFTLKGTEPKIVDTEGAREYRPRSKHSNSDDATTTNTDIAIGGTEMTFTDLEFAYPVPDATIDHSKSRQILKGLTFDVKEGDTVALVGSSGCGKSTITRMLYRFYNPDSGTITIGGHCIRDLSTESVRKAIAVVPQDTVLFNESIRYNIHYGDLDASFDDVVEAAKKAHIHETILSFPDGYDAVVGERGLKLSGGEKQRVAIARAILKKAPILLCDEPTSSLDSETEMDIMNNLKEVGEKNTTIIIAHRLSTIQDCDEIIVLDKGCVVERGTHDELLALGGRYNELLKMQQKQHRQEIKEVVDNAESFTTK